MLWFVLVVVLLIIGIIVLLTYIRLLKKDIKYITSQIKSSKGDFTSIKVSSLDKTLDDLALQINKSYDLCNIKNIKIINDEKELRGRIANISHDLRTPLTSIMGYLELLREEDLSGEEKKEYFDIITKRTKVLQNLINSFYDLSRIQSNENKLNLKSLNLTTLLSENLVSFFNEFKEKGIEPNIYIEEDLPNIISDESSVSRIFSNLLNNIIKHGEQEVYIELKKDGNTIISQFTNATSNLNEEDIELIFNSFYTKNPTRNDENTGLGLYIVKTLVEKLGNKVEANLKDGKLSIIIYWCI
ncbi:sensor histidine kinase [Clostridium grantii]|uniref:histidine kinase n=1 Tax=Clostridium grantii DSM 8605 TaxID=1121316 RepID=A0A1M5S3U4_9CLOT|nr:HAMP domain-containing sensor histidine kinase [Clostridium grantii]SHH33115.1 Signal transduction histidine kinase [Clostridium grantii DSM 8605]